MSNEIINNLYKNSVGLSKNTKKTYASVLSRFNLFLNERNKEINNFEERDIAAYLNKMNTDGNSYRTIMTHISAIKHFCKMSGKNITRYLKFRGVSEIRSKIRNVPKKRDFSNAYKEMSTNLRNKAIFLIFEETGLRLGELLALNREDVVDNQLHISQVRSNSIHQKRVLTITDRTAKAIKDYLTERNDSSEALLINNLGERISSRAIQHLFKPFNIKPSDFRDILISKLVLNGASPEMIKRVIGISENNYKLEIFIGYS